MKIQLPEKVKNIIQTIEKAGFEAYAVGGCVRDKILGREPEDWDITTSATPAEVKSLFRRTFDTGLKHGTITILIDSENFEVTTYRIDGIYEDKRRPSEVTYTSSLAEDLKRRDFTINAMAYNEREGLIDLYEGLKDIEEKTIRCVGEAGERFAEDALRMMRAVRFSAQLGYTIEEKTKQAIIDKAADINHISVERIRVELVKLIISPHPDFLRVAYEVGLTAQFFPEFDACMQTGQNHPHHCFSVGEHILHAMKAAPADKVLRLTMMFHDIAKPLTKTVNEKTGNDSFKGHSEKGAAMARKIMRRLKFDNDTTDKVYRLVLCHDYDIDRLDGIKIPDKYVRRSISQIGEDIYPLYLKVHAADIAAQSDYLKTEKLNYLAELNRIYEKVQEAKHCVTLKDLAITGTDLIAAGIPAGKKIGQILNALLDDVIDNPGHNEREYLLTAASNLNQPSDFSIIKVNKDNFHMFDEMTFYRKNKREKNEDERKEIQDFTDFYLTLENENFYVFAAQSNNQFVGYICTVYLPKITRVNSKGYLYIDEIWIKPNYRGKGIANALMKKADELSKEINTLGLRLYVSADNSEAISLYKKCGYEKKFGESLFMEKELK